MFFRPEHRSTRSSADATTIRGRRPSTPWRSARTGVARGRPRHGMRRRSQTRTVIDAARTRSAWSAPGHEGQAGLEKFDHFGLFARFGFERDKKGKFGHHDSSVNCKDDARLSRYDCPQSRTHGGSPSPHPPGTCIRCEVPGPRPFGEFRRS
jgi:hypothetical protein